MWYGLKRGKQEHLKAFRKWKSGVLWNKTEYGMAKFREDVGSLFDEINNSNKCIIPKL